MMDWYGENGYGWMSGIGMLMMLLFWIALIGLVVFVVTRLTRHESPRVEAAIETPKQILDRRLAAGEIDAAAYTSARKLIEKKAAGNGD